MTKNSMSTIDRGRREHFGVRQVNFFFFKFSLSHFHNRNILGIFEARWQKGRRERRGIIAYD